ncbi:carbohydrate binding domain-containing protein [uncultured Stenotrophomonas sp.]|uniref:carbohydrate binding domain-containing protein n=1 Tax=uncultured Stenotrophomonas sp. TaxID=165438 RepID=UPI0025DFE43E|nr:carbohydrate binding domain-containing protein [uncultured Stenotrophomonas sp.]
MLQRKLTLVDIGGSALPSPSPAPPRYANWFPMPYKAAVVPPVEGVTPNPVADGVLLEWAAVDQEGVIYVIERGPTAQGPWTEIRRTTETRYLYSDGSGQKWWFRITPTVRGKAGAGSTVEATPPTTTADLVEQQEKLVAETLARMRADAAEAAARAAAMAQAAQDLLAEATLRQQQYAEAMQGIADEARARADAVLNEKLVREAAISLEQQTRQSAVESLARALSEVAAGSGTQFDSRAIWYFDQTVEGWTGNGTPTLVDGWLRPANAASTPWVQSPAALAVDGSAYRFVKLRVKRVGSPTWAGFLQWITPSDQNWNTQKRVSIAEPAWDANGVATVDVQDIAWWPGTVDRIRLQLGAAQAVANYYLIDYVAVGRPTPGASVALVQAETLARTNAIAAEASQRNTLAVQMRGNYTGTDPLQLTSGLAYEELKARVAADSAQVQRINAMEVRMPAGTGGLATSASVTEEALARVSDVAALSQSITAVNAKLPALIAQGSNMVLNGGWDQGDNVGWSYSNMSGVAVVAEGRTGKCLKVTAPSGTRSMTANGAADLNIPVATGKKYRISAYYRTDADYNGTSGNGKIRIANQDNGLIAGLAFAANRTDWTRLEWIGTATTISALRVYVNSDHTAGTLWVDDVMVEEVTDILATAEGLQALTNTVQIQGGQISAQANLISALRTDVDGKASNSALQSLQSQVTLQGSDITSLGMAITNVTASLGSVGGDNLLGNSGFEQNGAGWTSSSGGLAGGVVTRSYVASALPSSKLAARWDFANVPVTGYWEFTTTSASKTMSVEPGKPVTLSAYVRGTPGARVFLQFRWQDANNQTISYSGTPADPARLVTAGSWDRKILTANAPATAAFCQVYVRAYGLGIADQWVEWDNVQVQLGNTASGYKLSTDELAEQTAINAAATTTLTGTVTALQGTVTSQGNAITTVTAVVDQGNRAGSNMYLDGSFEARPVGTVIQTWALVTTGGRTGTNAMTVSFASNTRSISLGTFDVAPDRVYYAEAWAKRVGPAAGNVQLRFNVSENGNSASYPNFQSISLAAISETEWTKVSGYVRIPAGKNRAIFQLNSANATTSATQLIWDDFVLQDVTEAYNAQQTAAGAASGVSALNATVTQQGQQITAQASRIDGVQASVNGKADASVVQEMRVQVNNQGAGGNLIANSTFPNWSANGWQWFDDKGQFDTLNTTSRNPIFIPLGALGALEAHGRGVVAAGVMAYGGTSQRVSVDPNKTYCVSAYVNAWRCRGRIVVEWQTSSGAPIGGLESNWVLNSNKESQPLANHIRSLGIGKPPANAAMARVLFQVEGRGEADPYAWFAYPMFSEVAEGATQAPAWASGDQASAQWNLDVQANGISAGLQLGVTGQTSALNILANAVNILSPGGADGFEMTQGYLRVWSGNSQRIIGNGFGTDGLVDYFGPNVGAANANKANATMWMDRNGNAYWGGAIAAGILRNANQSSSIQTTGNGVLVGPFDTNGRNKQVVVGYNRRHIRTKSALGPQGFVAGAGTNGGVINLYRQLDGQAETLWQQIPITGSVTINNEIDGPDTASSGWSASLTLNDNTDGTTRRSYRAEIVSFTEQTVSHQSGSFEGQTITQSLSVISIEQQ